MRATDKLFQLFLLFLPTQLSLHFWPDYSLIWGIRVDYLAPAVFLTDILFFFVFTTWIFEDKKAVLILKSSFRYFTLLFLFAALNILNSEIPPLSLFKWLKVLEFLAIFVYVSNQKNILSKIVGPLSLSMVFTFFLSVVQVINSGSIGGIFYWLGERSFTANTPGIALFNFLGNETLRPYGTFSHPNVLAGFSLVSFFLLFKSKEKLAFIGSFFALLSVIVSYSQNAWIAGVVALPFVFLVKHLKIRFENIVYAFSTISLMGGALSTQFTQFQLPKYIFERLRLNIVAGKLISMSPVMGTGLGTFVGLLPQALSLNVRWLQPVHNIFLLAAAETGLVGLCFFILFITKNTNRQNVILILVILLTGLFDHYWLTQQQTFLFLAIVVALRDVYASR